MIPWDAGVMGFKFVYSMKPPNSSGSPTCTTSSLTGETLERLRALGYIE